MTTCMTSISGNRPSGPVSGRSPSSILSSRMCSRSFDRSERTASQSSLLGLRAMGRATCAGRSGLLLGGSEAAMDLRRCLPHRWTIPCGERTLTVHVIRDLTALPPQDATRPIQRQGRTPHAILRLPVRAERGSQFLMAANDGQLIETLQRLPATANVARVRSYGGIASG